jgi:hypothetical protein
MEYTNLHYGSDHDLFQQAPPPTQQQGMKLQYQVAWLAVLVLIAWPLALSIVAPVYIFLLPLEPLLPVSTYLDWGSRF